jgi:hypothetical protein
LGRGGERERGKRVERGRRVERLRGREGSRIFKNYKVLI